MVIAEFKAYSEALMKEFMFLDIQSRSLRYWDEKGERQLCTPPGNETMKQERKALALATAKFLKAA